MTKSEYDNVCCLMRICGVNIPKDKIKFLFSTLNAHKNQTGEKELLPQIDKISQTLDLDVDDNEGKFSEKISRSEIIGYCPMCADATLMPFEYCVGERKKAPDTIKLPSYICQKCKVICTKLEVFNMFLNEFASRLGGRIGKI